MSLKVYIFAGKCIPIHAKSLEERPLGGTETGIIRVAESLAMRGHKVTVFTSYKNPPSPQSATEPRYLHASQLYQDPHCDVFISVQDWQGVLAQINTKRKYYWTGDGGEQYVNFGFGDRRLIKRIDGLLCVSRWQAQHLCEESGFPITKAYPILNGVHLPWFEGRETRNIKRLIYTSAPYRGLALTPQIFPLLRERFPDLELHIFAGLAVYDKETPFEGPEKEAYRKLCEVLKTIPGVVIHGNVPQKQLAREYMKSGLLFYPNIFRETSCIAALEAMAAGCPVVTSALGALPETVGKAGIVIGGKIGSMDYNRTFVRACSSLIENQKLWANHSSSAYAQVHEQHSWDHVATRLEEVFLRHL